MCTYLTICRLLTCFNSLTLIWVALEGILIGPVFFFLIKLMGEWKAPKVQNRNTQWHKHDLPGVVWWEWDGRMRFWVWSLWSWNRIYDGSSVLRERWAEAACWALAAEALFSLWLWPLALIRPLLFGTWGQVEVDARKAVEFGPLFGNASSVTGENIFPLRSLP